MDFIFNYFKDKLIGGSGTVLTYMSNASLDLFSNSIVTNILLLFEYIGYILFAVGVLFGIANVYIEYLENESLNVHLFIMNVIKAIIAMAFLKVGAIWLYDLSNIINSSVSQIVSVPNYNNQVSNINSALGSDTSINVVWLVIIGLIVLFGLITSLVQIMKRGGLYMAQIILGYVYVFSIPSGNVDGFIEWCKTTASIAITNILQTALLYVGLALMSNDITKLFLGLGLIMSASSVEKIAGRFGMAASKSGRSPNMMAPMMAFRNMNSSASFAGGAASSFAGAADSAVTGLVAA